ncbi:MAG TPA: hypothetical protein VEY06_08850 [Flavisolibacter sp.]|jgi:hypothetical protein|nr:hypothetical protein [Flavisolibacter sp.]
MDCSNDIIKTARVILAAYILLPAGVIASKQLNNANTACTGYNPGLTDEF